MHAAFPASVTSGPHRPSASDPCPWSRPSASGIATYLQLVQQVRQALQLGLLEPGDQLPTAQQVVAQLAINPNTVLKAYRDLEREGLVRARPGQGTFISRSLPRTDPAAQSRFLGSMTE